MAELKNCSSNYYQGLCGVNVTIDPQSTFIADNDKVLIVGQVSETATAASGLYKVVDDTRGELFGIGSMINRQIDEFQDLSPTTEVWAYVVPNDGTSSKAEVTISGVDTATSSGNVYLWVNGQAYQASFDPNTESSTNTNVDVAEQLQAVISDTDTSLVATVSGDTLIIETMIKGAVGGFLDVRTSYDRMPELRSSDEVTVTADVTKATGYPDLSGLAELDNGFEFVISPYYDNKSVTNLSTYLCGQWSGGANSRGYTVAYGKYPDLSALGSNTNNALISFIGLDGALTPSYLETSSYGGLIFRQLNSDSDEMAMSMSGKVMPAMLAPESDDEFTKQQKANLVASGMGYFNVNTNNSVAIGRAVTSYTIADNGSADLSMQDVNKPAMIAYISRYFREQLTQKYTGYAFRRDGVIGSTSGKVMTLTGVRNYLTTLGQYLSNRNIIQNLPDFIDSMAVTLNDNGCVEINTPTELVDQFCCLNVNLQPS